MMNKENKREALKLYVRFAAFSLITLVVIGFFLFRISYQRIRKQIEISEKHKVEVVSLWTEELMQTIKADVNIMAQQHQLFRSEEQGNCKKFLSKMYENVGNSRAIYDQVRFIDVDGMEVVRINYDEKFSYIVPEAELQYKGDRYYFKNIMKLEKDSVYFSQMDLNIEAEEIELPLKPMIRIGRKVFDQQDSLIGVVIVNFKGKILLDKLRAMGNSEFTQPVLINSDGYYLIGKTLEEEWGFMFADRQQFNFKTDYPLAAEIIFKEQNGTFSNKNGLFTFTTIDPLLVTQKMDSVASPLNWKVVAHVDGQQLSNNILGQLWIWIGLSILLAIGLLFSLWKLAFTITSRSAARKELKQVNKQLRRSNNTLKKFFSIIAHDLRAPFSGLIGLSEMLTNYYEDYSDEEKKSMIEAISKSGQNTFELLENLLSWSRSQTNNLKALPQNIALKPLIDDAIALMQDNADKKKITISLAENHFEDLRLHADEEMLKVVVRNLLSNALKFTPTGGNIVISAQLANDKAKISISDSGIGMREEQLQKLFKADKMASTPGTEKEVGTGLGLLLCKEFVTLNGGTIQAESTLGKGSTFTIDIPLAAAE